MQNKLRPRCAQCREGENDVPADFFIKGKIMSYDDKPIPYRGHMCADHLTVLKQDRDLQVEYIELIDEDALTERHTAFITLRALCNAAGGYFPSLRTKTAPTYRDRQELRRLADMYDAAQKAAGDPRRAMRT